MGRKATAQSEIKEGSSKADLLEQVRRDIVQNYKSENIVSDVNSILDKKEDIIPVSPALDDVLNGGICGGVWVSVIGKAKVGKTTTLLSCAAEAQKPEYGDRTVVYIDAENRLKKMNLTGIKGLNLSKDKFIVIASDKEKILSSQDALNIALMYLKSIPKVFLIIDSISALVDQRIYEGGIGTETRGSGAKIVSQFIDLAKDVVRINDAIVACVVHLYANTGNTGGMGSTTVEKTATHLTYQNDYKIIAKWAEKWMSGERQIGQKIHWEVACTALGPPGGKCESYLRYGVGIDKIYELFEIATNIGLIEKGGAWYSFSFLGDKAQKFQGGENSYQALVDNSEWLEILKEKVKSFLSPVTP